MHDRVTGIVLGSRIDVLDWQTTVDRIDLWSRNRESRIVCVCNAHSVVTAQRDPALAQAIMISDMATPDGAPVAWLLRKLGAHNQERINGPDLMLKYCDHASQIGQSIYLYGATEKTLFLLMQNLHERFPSLQIAGFCAPPFRALSEDEDNQVVDSINASGAGIVWVSLGCPKQEKWMADHKGRINAVMVGVGAAFDYHANTIQRAPMWMQKHGLEWLYRLFREPRRLWKRYLVTNTFFIWYASMQLFKQRRSSIT